MKPTRLPAISIKTDVSAAEFLQRVSGIAPVAGYQVATLEIESTLPPMTLVTVAPLISELPHHEPCIQFIARHGVEDRVFCEVRATRWIPDMSPTCDTYVHAADQLIGPILRAYNRHHRSTRRLQIATQRSLEPRLSAGVDEKLRRFLQTADRGTIGPADWDRFYSVVVHAVKHRAEFSEADLEWILRAEGFSESAIHDLLMARLHGMKLLARRW